MTNEEAKRIIKSEMCKNCGVYLGGGECDKDCRVIQCIEALSTEPYKAKSEVQDVELVRQELLDRGDEVVTFRQLVERFEEVEEEFGSTPWNLRQIYNNFNILTGEKPCTDVISREQAFKCFTWTNTKDDAYYGIKALPPVAPKSKTGHWINGDPICPCCGEDKYKDLDADVWSDWQPRCCPNCGAKMIKPQESE